MVSLGDVIRESFLKEMKFGLGFKECEKLWQKEEEENLGKGDL